MNQQPLIAVVGMDGIFPGAHTLEAYWKTIVEGIDCSAPVPDNRWIAPRHDRLRSRQVPDTTYSRHACLIDDFSFDPAAFCMDPKLTRQLDPVHQLTLTAGKRAVSGCQTADVDLNRVHTILAAIALPTDSASAFSRQIMGRAIEQRLFAKPSTPPIALNRNDAFASRVDGLPAALLAAEMGFGGDSFTLDAACASSIYAVKLACGALTSMRADMVVTGGVSRPECLYTQTGFSQLQALSPSGRCAPFDHQADGLVVGEGVGILVLKRLNDAIDHGDAIHGVIHGIGLSNDMRGNLLAPERRGQVRAMQAAYRSAGWRPSDVDLIECHGTGTRIGDTTEIESLVQLWKDESTSSSPCAIGSVKSMIGHLLTGAGAAGMIKTLLAMQYGILPPSINFEQAPPDSPLPDSPFRVQVSAQPWHPREDGSPRRAAVSAFGFGGINAHILFQEYPAVSRKASPGLSAPISVQRSRASAENRSLPPVAIVGMDATVGSFSNLKSFEKAIFEGRSAIGRRPLQRWKGIDTALIDALGGMDPLGGYIDHLELNIGEYQIPPNEINDILPQQLLALKVGLGAMRDAGLPIREPRARMGVVVGIGFDFEATNYHLRWHLYSAARHWNQMHKLDLSDAAINQWLAKLRDNCHPPLTPTRVMGALGGIVASRMAREFRFGGPSFVVSADAASGIKALQIAVDLLQDGQIDTMLVGAVDLAAEGRSVIRMAQFMPLSGSNRIRPLDGSADGTLPGDGAVALVLKRLDQARRDGDRIYAVIRGIGAAGGDRLDKGDLRPTTYRRSLGQAFHGTAVKPDSVSYVETHGAGVPNWDRLELGALAAFFSMGHSGDPSKAIALGSTTPIGGHIGAADGLLALAKTALCLHHRRLPPLLGCTELAKASHQPQPFHVPQCAQPWYRNRDDGPRTACCASITVDGTCSHVLLQAHECAPENTAAIYCAPNRKANCGLFVITGDSPAQLVEGLSRLEAHLMHNHDPSLLESSAATWMQMHPPESVHGLAIGMVLKADQAPTEMLIKARQAIENDGAQALSKQVFYTSHPIGADGQVAWIYPGSGNHYLGMGRELALRFPDIVAGMDRSTGRLKDQFRPWRLMPWRQSWQPGWEATAADELTSDPLNMIFGQVVFGSLMTEILGQFSIPTDAIIGYSLGESAALFAHRVWSDRGDMLARMLNTDLFTTRLAGPCTALRQAWRIPENKPVNWQVAVVNRSVEHLQPVLSRIDHVRLLIVNSPQECVIGGLAPAVDQAIDRLGCQAVFLDGVVTVHCDAVRPVARAYRQLHHFPTVVPTGLSVYSCSRTAAYAVNPDSVADSIVQQAVKGFDFTQTIKRAYADGCRVFIETGPQASCTRMIDQILTGQPHLAVAANRGTQSEIVSLLRCLAQLATQRVPLELDRLYANVASTDPSAVLSERSVAVIAGGYEIRPAQPNRTKTGTADKKPLLSVDPIQSKPLPPAPDEPSVMPLSSEAPQTQLEQLLATARQNMETTTSAHQQFLDLSRELTQAFADTVDLQNRLLGLGARPQGNQRVSASPSEAIQGNLPTHPAFDRDMCMQFATGSVGRMLGPAFDVVDTYPVRVRLPDEPLMLVDRILSVRGEMLSLDAGQVVTEHDVLPGAWYLDGDRAPVCISVEAGQADLFLSSFLGIDHQVKGERAYRLLDAEVTFHRGLPRPGETIRYEIAIDRFARQGDTWMFFFRFEGTIGDQHLISMRDGCAGFFTAEEVHHSGGIILTQAEQAPVATKRPADWRPLVPMANDSYSDDQLDALRRGDLAGCFGPLFADISLAGSLWLPDGRMRLIHRVLELDPEGGRYGLGLIRAEADIHPDDWFLTCHFVDDMVMPGTLMYECCAHTLRVFLQRMGWVTDRSGVCYEPVIGNAARLKCRGPVTPATRQVCYEIQISEMGYGPEPYAIADAHMFADGRHIVFFKNMSIKMTGIDREAIEDLWRQSKKSAATSGQAFAPDTPLFDKAAILAFAVGNPSAAFGEPYRIFDSDRTIARLPGPPYCFLDRVIRVEPKPWQLEPGGWVTAQYDISPNEWYFVADHSGMMPFCVLLEIALQPCGWLAAYAGSALKSKRDLKFRNLGGSAVLHRHIAPHHGTLTMRCRMTKVSEAADMIIENFDFEVLSGSQPVYGGKTYFGFFSAEALIHQKGLGDSDPLVAALASYSGITAGAIDLTVRDPLTPESAANGSLTTERLEMPGKALLMIDVIEAYLPDGGDSGLGYIRGSKQVDPEEWFFKAHFYQDPVCPGSLGIESFLQLLKTVAMKRWPQLMATHRFALVFGSRHHWTYRGQIIPHNKTIAVEAQITHITDSPMPVIQADGLLSVDGLAIYKMENFKLALVPAATR